MEFQLYICLVLLENQKVIHSFTNKAQPSLDKLSGDITGIVLLVGGPTVNWGGHALHRWFSAVLTDEFEL